MQISQQSQQEQDKLSNAPSYFSRDTIAAIATGTGGAISIVRVSGRSALALAQKLSQSKEFSPREMKLVRLSDGKQSLDQALVVYFQRPNSYTGEDVLEFHLHGGSHVAAAVLEALIRNGARQALPGEFSFRAVRNGKLTLSQAEAVSELIEAKNENARELALEKLDGSQRRFIADLAQKLMNLASKGELGIDFADQDVDELSLETLKVQSEKIKDDLTRLAESFDRGSRIQEGIPTVFLGLPNAGKSSLFNALLGEDRSIVTAVPGTTRDILREQLELRTADKTVLFRIEDTAGIRSEAEEVEAIGIERSLKAAQSSDLIVWVIDGTSPELEKLKTIQHELEDFSGTQIAVLTKVDLLSDSETDSRLQEIEQLFRLKALPLSSVQHLGLKNLAQRMVRVSSQKIQRHPGEVILTRLDHLRAVENALIAMERAKEATEIDLFASDLKQALHALEPLIGITVPDDLLQKIFSEFCIGK